MTTTTSIYKHIFEFSPSPVAIFDTNGDCRLANRAFYIQLGYDFEEDEKPALMLDNLFYNQETLEVFFNRIENQEVVRRWEAQLKTSEGDSMPALLSGRVLEYRGRQSYEITFTNITQLAKIQQSIRRSHHRVTSLIENLAAGLFLVNRRGNITDANTALGTLVQCDPDTLVSKHYHILLSNLIVAVSEPDIVQYALQEAVQNVTQYPVLELNLIEGQQYLELKLFPVWNDDGLSLGWGGLVQDVTEQREQTTWKLELLSILAHDLRTPLATLKGHATALLANYRTWGTEMGMEFLTTINRNVDELIRQVDRNLALTRVETARFGLRTEAIEPESLLQQAIERAAGSLSERKIEFDLPDDLPQLRVDPARSEEVLINLLDNAVRYTPTEKPILIQARSLDNWLQISVIDQGLGIPKENQTKIFEKYVRGESEGEGTGLGLYISRKIVEAHGGRIWVDSPTSGEDQGAAFTFTLPILPNIPTETTTSQAFHEFAISAEEDRLTDGEKVLVVEDEVDVQTLLRTILSQEGYHVEIAPDGPTALDIIQVDPPNLVLLDWMMPGMRGLQVCRNIRRWSNIPIIMVTSKTSQADLIAALDAGADDYVTKPFQTEELLARIRALIRRGGDLELEMGDDQFNAEGMRIDYGGRSVWLLGKLLELTPTEYTILIYLARHRGQVVTYDQLIDQIGNHAKKGRRHRLFVHISRLRDKIENDPKKPRFIQTKWGVGYVFLPRE